jgi:hypothetical protein
MANSSELLELMQLGDLFPFYCFTELSDTTLMRVRIEVFRPFLFVEVEKRTMTSFGKW